MNIAVVRGALVLAALVPLSAVADDEGRFERYVRPTLATTCFPCHGGKKTSGGLRVDSIEALRRGGKSGPAVMPGDPESSLLIQAVRGTHDDLKMPPGKPIAPEIVSRLADWVRAGAFWPGRAGATFRSERHWAFEPVRDVSPPEGPHEHPIDRFLEAGRRANGLNVVEPVPRRTLIRRLTFDLIGFPPSPEETAAFLADNRPDALERLVDRLLASPHYGERWGRHWLDVARHADTAGDNADYPVPELSRYRDHVIDAFNRDMPYDRFVREQIAGDLIATEGPPESYAERVVATGFLALARRYATAPYELWHLTLEDAIDTTGRAILGMTFRCARCHDHKFDPVTQKDYYALYGVFASTTFPYAGSEEFQSMSRPRERFAPLLPPSEARPRLEAHRAALTALEDRVKSSEAAKESPEMLRSLQAELEKLRRPGLPVDLPGAYGVSEGTPVDVPLQIGGDPARPGAVVPRGAPGFLAGFGCPPPPIPSASTGRRELADWLTRPDHPLTARVLVNRVWQHHFGRGIVATPSNFGIRGEPPTHPELLDWLTRSFIAGGWSIKSLHRLIVTSAAYRLSSRDDASNATRDPENRLLWRFDRRRLDAEAIRDAMLAVSGNLDRTLPPPHPFPPIERWNWTQHNPFKESYATSRRTVYLMTQRLQRHPYLALFDGPDPNSSTEARTSSTVPLQALYLSNSPWVNDRARAFAARIEGEEPDRSRRVQRAVSLAWNRPTTADERRRLLGYVDAFTEGSIASRASPRDAEREAWASLARLLLTANEFLYLD